MICGFGDFLGLSVLSMTSESSWRSRSNDARLRAWFCIRGRSVEERAINNSGTGKQRRGQAVGRGYHVRFPRAKRRDACPKTQRPGLAAGPSVLPLLGGQTLFVFFRLFLGRRQPLEPLEQLLLGHALGRDLGVVGIDRPAGSADQRNRSRLRLVDLDVFLQRMDQLFL